MNAALDKTYTSLMPKQRDALIAAGKGQDVIVTVPTGYGKSLIYQDLPFRWRTAPRFVVASPLDAIIAEKASCNQTVLIDQTLVNEVFTPIIKCGMQLFINSQTSSMQPLKIGNS